MVLGGSAVSCPRWVPRNGGNSWPGSSACGGSHVFSPAPRSSDRRRSGRRGASIAAQVASESHDFGPSASPERSDQRTERRRYPDQPLVSGGPGCRRDGEMFPVARGYLALAAERPPKRPSIRNCRVQGRSACRSAGRHGSSRSRAQRRPTAALLADVALRGPRLSARTPVRAVRCPSPGRSAWSRQESDSTSGERVVVTRRDSDARTSSGSAATAFARGSGLVEEGSEDPRRSCVFRSPRPPRTPSRGWIRRIVVGGRRHTGSYLRRG